jgi:hypothetical protein
MNLPIRIGMDTSKSVFQLHGVDENEGVVVRRQFRRAEMSRRTDAWCHSTASQSMRRSRIPRPRKRMLSGAQSMMIGR